MAGGVVAMHLGVDEKTNRLEADFAGWRRRPCPILGVLCVDHEDAVGSSEYTNPAVRGVLMARVGAG